MLVAILGIALPAAAQPTTFRKIGEMELRLLGVTATVDPPRPVVPKNIPAAVRIVVRAGQSELSLADALRFLGPNIEVHGDLSGPGLRETVSLPVRNPGEPLPADPLLLPLPGLTVSGNYTLANLRIESEGRPVLDVTPQSITVEVIEQVLVTSVKTRALTLDEIREKGIVLDSDDYLGFEFTLGLKLESQPVNLTFPVVFDRQGVPIPDPLTPPPPPARQGVPMPSVVPLLLEAFQEGTGGDGGGGQKIPITLPNGQPVRIPAVLVIPGNVGYLKQFFSAQLFVANGAPPGSGLTVKKVTGTVHLPPGADRELGTDDDPLALPETVRGPQPETLPIMGLGPDGKPGTDDDVARFTPGEQGQAEFLIRGEREGFHALDFDIAAVLDGLVSGPVNIKGKASGGVLVRNPFFDMTFTVPSVVRRGERFKLYASVTNIGQGLANDVTVSLDAAALSGARLVSDQTVHIDTLRTGDSRTVVFELESQKTGQVVASYLKLEGPGQSGGTLRFSLGVGERGVPLSPDTLVLPAAVDSVPADIVDAAMRVLGQAWSVANAPSGTLPRGVIRTSKQVVVAKALGLAEAGLRISLGQDVTSSLRALDYDFFAGTPRDPGFDQLLHDTEAGQALRHAFGGQAPTEEPTDAGGPRLEAASVIGPEVLAGAGPFGLHAILVFDRILDAATAAVPARYTIASNTVRSAKAVLSGRLVILNLAQPEGPYVPARVDATGLLDLRGRRGSGSAELVARLADPGAIVSGRVINADGTPVNTASVVYSNNTDVACGFPAQGGLASAHVDGDGRFEYRYVRRDNCGLPFEMLTQDPGTGAQRKSTGFVRSGGERIVLDIVLLGRGSVEGIVRDLANQPVSGARVVAISGSDPQSGGQATTDGLGHYRIDGITVGPVAVNAAKGAGLGRGAGRIERAGTVATVNVVLDSGSVKVSGTVRKLESGVETTVPGVGVIYAIDAAAVPVGYVKTGSDGRFQLEGMPAGSALLKTQLDTGERASTPFFTTAPGDNLQNRDLLVVIQPPEQTGSVDGVVSLPGGAPAVGAVVTVGPRGVLTAADGSFRLDGIPVQPGQSQSLSARSADGRRQASTTFQVNSPGEVAHVPVTLSGVGAVRFTVLDPAGVALPNQEVRVTTASCSDPCGCSPRNTDASGQVTYDNVGLGTFLVKAIRGTTEGYESVTASASVTRDGETAFGILRFDGLGTVSGLVLDPQARPAFGADVALVSPHFVNDGFFYCGMVTGESHRARTGTDGRFRFTGVGIGTHSLSAKQDFYPTPATATGTLTAGGQEQSYTLQLRDTTAGVLSGTVFLPDGVTPAGRGVQVTANGGLPDVMVETNDQGKYRFAKIFPEGSYTLTLSDPVTAGRAQTLVFLRAGQDLAQDIRLKGRGTVRVTVVDGANQPVSTAYVKLQENDFPRRSYEGAVEPPDQGTAPIAGVYEGPFSIEAKDVFARGGRASGTMPRAGEIVEIKVRLTSTGTVRGHFRMPDGATVIPNGVVKLTAAGKVIGQVTTLGSGDVGRFTFDYVPAGPVRLEAEDPLTGRTGVAVGEIETEGQVLELDVRAQALGSVEGIVTSNGQPQAVASVTVVSGAYLASTLSDASGSYLVRGVPAGRITATASLAGGFLQGTNAGNLDEEGATLPLDVALRGSGQVTGQVLAADGVTPGPTSVVRITVGGTGGASLTTVTQAEGRFSFDRVPAGQAQLEADVVSSSDNGRATAVVPSGGSVDVPLPLRGLGVVRGVTRDSAGNATAGFVTLNVTGTPGFAVNVGTAGTFELPEVPAGPFTATLRVTSGGFTLYGSAAGEIVPGTVTEVALQVQPSGTVTGIVRRPGGTTAAYGAQVAVRLANGTLVTVQAQEDGRFTARGVPLGVFTVTASDPITAGLAVLRDQSLTANGQVLDVGILVLDATPPTLLPVEPVPGSIRAAFAGPLVLDLADAGGVDLASLVMTAPNGVAATPFVIANGRATTTLRTDLLVVGDNRLVAQVKDLSGNLTTTEWHFTITGGTVRGTVVRADGNPAAGAPLKLDGVAKPPADAAGRFVFTGLRPGGHQILATDLETGLTSFTSLNLGDGEDLTLTDPVRLPAFGRIAGIVKRADGTPAPGVVVSVPFRPGSVSTGPDGHFDLGAFTLGSYTVDASAADGDRGRTNVTLTTLGVTVNAEILLNGVGVVRVTLKDGAGALVGGAAVTVTSSSPLAGVLTGSTASDGGAAAFTSVLAGTITARATHPTNGLHGETTGLLTPGGLLDLAPMLQPTGRITGTVSRREGGAAAGVTVSLTQPRSQTTTTAANGSFSFEEVPLGNWALSVSDSATGDVGQASGILATAGGTANADVTLNGVGTVWVTVRDAADALVANASVQVASSAGRQYSAATDAAGFVSVPNVLAGTISVNATHPTNGTRGSATGTLAAAGSLDLTARLQATGTVRGTVLAPDGAAVSGASVSVGFAPQITGPTGEFVFTDVPLGNYNLSATLAGRLRARVAVSLTTNGQSVTQDLTLVGVASVNGRLTDALDLPVASAQVSLFSLAAIYGGTFSATTDATGHYQVSDVPIGAFTLSAARGADRASANGTVVAHGVDVTVDLQLLPSAVDLPLNLNDGNGFQWRVNRDGTFSHSPTFKTPEGGAQLTLVRNTVASTFAGPACTSTCTAATEEGKREVVLPESGVGGLEVTRKVYVATDGYFARHLDVVRNPESGPVTFDLTLTSHFVASSVLTTSSGDATLGADDRWLTVDDADATNPYDSVFAPGNSFWPQAVVTSGAGGQGPTSVSSAVSGDGSRLVAETWGAVTLAPGESFGLLRFESAQVDRTRAQAAAERLVQLPPEALVGLTTEEGASVRNFVVPPGLASAVPPLPANDGIVNGRVFAGDGQTPGGARQVELRSRSPYYGRPLSVTSNGSTGDYEVRGDPATSAVVPRVAFDLASSAPVFGTQTASASGDFAIDASGQPARTASLDLVYRGTGIVAVSVARGDGSPISNVGLALSGTGGTMFAGTGASGAATYVLVPPGTYSLKATMLFGPEQTVPVTVVADQKVAVPVVFAALGTIEGTLRTSVGQPQRGTVRIDEPGLSRSVGADAATGFYRIVDVPFGAHDVEAVDDSRSGVVLTRSVTVGGAATGIDFQFPPVGRVNVTVKLGSLSGGPLQTAVVSWKADARGPDFVFSGYTNSIGQFSIPFVAGPQFRARAAHPANAASYGESPLTSITEGQTVDVTLVVPGVGNVTGTLRSRDGVPIGSGHSITALGIGSSAVLANGFSDAAGAFTLPSVPVGDFRLQATCNSSFSFQFLLAAKAERDASVPSDGAAVSKDALCSVGQVTASKRRDFWSVSATAGEAFSLTLAASTSGTALPDPYLEVYGPDGTLVGSNDNRAPNDLTATVDFTAPTAGTYVAVARAAGAQAGGYRLGTLTNGIDPVPALRAFDPPRVRGVARKDSNSVAVPGQAVRILGNGTMREAVTAGADGAFDLGVFPLGAFTLEATDGEGVLVARATGTAPTLGVDVTQDLTVPARGTVSVLVRRGAELLADLPVTLTSTHAGAFDEDRIRTRSTAADGTLSTTLPTGPVTARVSDPRNGATYEVGDTLTDGAILALTIDLPASLTHLVGTVTAGDQTTVLPGAAVTLSGPFAFSTTANAAGQYDFDSLPPGTYSLTAAIGGASATESVVLNGGERTVDLRVNLNVLHGQVTEADATTPAMAQVELCGGFPYGCVFTDTGPTGLYAFYGGFPASWTDFTQVTARVTALDDSGLTQYAFFSFRTGVTAQDFSLPPAWAVYGVVRDAQGPPVSAEVRLANSFGAPRSQQTGPGGTFRFPHVQDFASVVVRAADLSYSLPGQASGTVEGGDLELDVTLAPGASLAGQLFDSAGGPLAASITFESLPYTAIDGWSRWTRPVATDAGGRFSTVLPAGGYRAVHDPGACSGTLPARRLLAVADGTLVEGPNPDVTLRVGEGGPYPAVLAGSLGAYGPSPLHPSRDRCAETGEVTLTARGVNDPSPAAASRLSADGRTATSLLSQADGLDLRQEQFVPPSGAFLRTITWIQNPSDAEIIANVEVAADFGDGENFSLVDDTDGNHFVDVSDTYASARLLTDDTSVEAGAAWGNGAVGASFQRGYHGDGDVRAGITASFSVPVPAHGRVGLMAFVVGRAGNLGAPSQVRALAELSDLEALLGLDEDDRNDIVNFTVPAVPNPGTGVLGTVTRDDGSVCASAPVMAVDPLEGTVLAYAIADGSGQFVLRGLLPGDVRVIAVDPATNRPGASTATVTAATLATADVAVIPASEMGTVHGTVRNGSDEPVVGAHVIVATNGIFDPLWKAEAVSDTSGEYTVAAPAGFVRAHLRDDPFNENSGSLDPGGTLDLDLTTP